VPEQLALFEPSQDPSPVGPADVPPETRSIAARLGPEIYLGTSSWAFPGWKGIVYDRAVSKTVLSRRGLAAYSRHPLLRSVGIDRTYYGPIAASDFRAYADQVSEEFRFVVKAHELLTRARMRDPFASKNERFLDSSYAEDEVIGPCLEGLGSKAGVLLFQFPPQSVPGLGGAGAFAGDLHRFLDRLPREILYAVELRNSELLTSQYVEALADAGASHCFNVHPTMPDVAAQAERVGRGRFPALVVRWMLRHGREYEDARDAFYPFDRVAEPDDGARSAIAALCREATAAAKRAFVIVNNKAEGSAPLSVARLAEELGNAK
jgi:uncharacterized protein YecE (DUF72 family)